ncbi:hypothetical protein GCM10009038_00020 [Salinicola rhizosphaerae]|uniref:Uncharacterized protein n=1 Tax=Salinicola rhizosphaerae TaxID=1443141 RepID=A0ABQ3DRX0_9GAMM|nr:hypothetical protein GCM10009038_00020 [Salinicola rhizosphaerae]
MDFDKDDAEKLVESGMMPYRVSWESSVHGLILVSVIHECEALPRNIPQGVFRNQLALVRWIDLLRSEAEYRFGQPCGIWEEGDQIKSVRIARLP